MNNAKKLAKNGGIGTAKPAGTTGGSTFTDSKNKILLLIGIAAIVVLCAGVMYMQLRPRAILTVSGVDATGGTASKTVYMKEAMYDIYQAETQYNMYESVYQQMYGTTYWEMENADEDGRTGASAAKKQVMDAIKQREILCMEAEKYQYSLTDEEKKACAENVDTAMGDMNDAQKKLLGLDRDTLITVFEKNALAEKYRQVLIADAGINTEALKATVDKDEYRQYTLQYYMVSNKTGGDDSQTSTTAAVESEQVDVTPEQKKTNLTNIKAIQEKAKTAEDFTTLVAEDDTTGITYETEDLIAKDMETSEFLTEKLRKQIIKMKNGEISDIIEGDDGYYLVKMVDNNDNAAYDEQCETVVSEEEDKQFEAKYDSLSAMYTTEVQSYWKSRVKLGGNTAVE